ncbi:DUF948 domain-containing protein [Cellulomonas marina]|uniref:DUF948 domain-containing protein n=1 Tax=Cellulomonas marina TaxID=988821 RepID=A0A1I0W7W8_9CELL|nr:DUF948 domain-containing protein [Cellulomonas marina]GIG29142.1 hypothetical protein Cma02nite_17420 [Cellulomonas marina]SFA84388.1 protein of unknown function [Cellulomonas marina]
MSVGDIAGLLAAIAFVVLVAMLGMVLTKVGRVVDGLRDSLREVTDHALPVIDEAAGVIASTNAQLGKVDTVTTSAAQVSENVSALTALVAATVGTPLIKVASFSYAARRALATLLERAGGPAAGGPAAAPRPAAGGATAATAGTRS